MTIGIGCLLIAMVGGAGDGKPSGDPLTHHRKVSFNLGISGTGLFLELSSYDLPSFGKIDLPRRTNFRLAYYFVTTRPGQSGGLGSVADPLNLPVPSLPMPGLVRLGINPEFWTLLDEIDDL